MSALALLLGFGRMALAGSVDEIVPGPQPLEDADALLLALEDLCGGLLDATEELSDLLATYETCDVRITPTRFEVRRHTDSVEFRFSPHAQTELDSIETENLALLEALGFDPDEFSEVHTSDLVAEDRDDGQEPVRRFVASKTFVDRRVSGGLVVGSRAVVTRDSSGQLVRIHGTWPTFQVGASAALSDDAGLTEATAATLVDGTVFSLDRIFVPHEDDAGQVVSGTVYNQILYKRDPASEGKVTSVVLFDGEVVEPQVLLEELR